MRSLFILLLLGLCTKNLSATEPDSPKTSNSITSNCIPGMIRLHRDASYQTNSWGLIAMTGIFNSGDLQKLDSRELSSRHLPVMLSLATDGQGGFFKNSSLPKFMHLGVYLNWSVNEVSARQNFNERTYLWGVGGRIGTSVLGLVNALNKSKHIILENVDFHVGIQTGYRIYPHSNVVARLFNIKEDIILFPYLGFSYDFTKRTSFIFELGKSAQSYVNIGMCLNLAKIRNND